MTLTSTPVQFLKGVGPARAELLGRLGLATAADLLFYFPRDYQDLTDLRSIDSLEPDTETSVHGTVAEVELRGTGIGKCKLGVLVRDPTGYLRALWFNQPYMQEKFRVGQEVMLSGKAARRGGRWEMAHPRVQWIESEEQPTAGPLLPIYPLTEGLSQGHLRQAARAAVTAAAAGLEDLFPPEFLARKRLPALPAAIAEIHAPTSRAALEAARRRLIYQELLVLQLALAIRRQAREALRRAPPLAASGLIDARISRLFRFELTAAQRRAIDEIAADMARATPMNRLLQGDVGSGKTVVAVYAMLLAVAHGCQAALMAPTEILARQHARTLGRLLAASKVRTCLLTGSLTARQRQDSLARIAAGEADLVIGTQAIVQSEVAFARLGLVVIDEQHKFGVRQRATLKQSAADPHYLVMTATPIPRTVTMTLYGDLDVSTLAELPPGRQSVHTYLAAPPDRPRWWEFFRRKLGQGRQGYVIAPLVEESDQVDTANVAALFESLAHGELEAFRLGLVHGRMSADEKESVMQAFESGDIQVLVATGVVEVGIDVPNATLMTICGAERFGLAQLHQLRGRIHRGKHPGFCCVFSDAAGEESAARLKSFVEISDGFRLAEIDFEQRGPGDMLGTRQHGLSTFRIADLTRDAAILAEARADAAELVAADPGLSRPNHALLRRQVHSKYGQALDLGDVG